MPTFENGWICRECWSANREVDARCYRCHAVPKRTEMPAATTFSTPDGMPNEERNKVSSLTRPAVAQPAEPSAPKPAVEATPLSERMRGLVILARLRSAIAAVTGAFARIGSFGRAVGHAPGAGARLVSQGVHGARSEANSMARSAIAHRRVWLSAAWVISGVSCALLFSAALRAPLAASLLVVASVAIFSSLSAAITTNTSERQARAIGDAAQHPERADLRHDPALVIPAEHSAQPAEILGSRPAR
jgi:hypothetical protein